MQKARLKLVKREPVLKAVTDEDLAELARLMGLAALSAKKAQTRADGINARIAAGAPLNCKDWTLVNGAPERIVAAKAAGGGK